MHNLLGRASIMHAAPDESAVCVSAPAGRGAEVATHPHERYLCTGIFKFIQYERISNLVQDGHRPNVTSQSLQHVASVIYINTHQISSIGARENMHRSRIGATRSTYP